MVKLALKSLDGLHDALKSEYEKKGDLFVLKGEASEGYELAGPELRAALETERGRRKAVESQLKGYEGLPENARDQLAEFERLRAASGKGDEAMKAAKAKFDADLAAEREQRTTLNTKLESLVLERALDDALLKHGGIPDRLRPHLRPRLKLDGDRAVVADPATGNVMMTRRPGSTDAMSVDEFVEDIKRSSAFDWGFAANKGGRGTGGSGGTGEPSAVPRTMTRDEWRKADPADHLSGKVQVATT